MKNNHNFLNHVKRDLQEAFDLYYNLTFGFYDLEKVREKKIRDLSEVVKAEVYEKGGKFYELFEKISKVEKEIYDFEDEMRKGDKDFDIDEGLSVRISDLYSDALRGIGELMFMYGVTYGKNLESYLDEFPVEIRKEKIYGRY